MVKVPRLLSMVLVIFCISALTSYVGNTCEAGDFKGKVIDIVLGDKPKSGTITIATEAGEKTFNVTKKTGVKILDKDNKTTKADLGSILCEKKDGADKADTAEITSKDGVAASKILATTTRAMTLTQEEVKKRLAEILQGNAAMLEKAKTAADNPGSVKGKVKVFTRHSGDTIISIEKVGDGNFTPAKKEHVAEGAGLIKKKSDGSPREYPVMDQMNIAFTPHVLPVLKGSVVDFPNSDTVRHNVSSLEPIPGTSEKINLGTYKKGTIKTVEVPNAGEVILLCNVHSEMSGFIVAMDNPYFTLTDRKGNFAIENVPPGAYTLTTWHEKYASVSKEVTVEAGKAADVTMPNMKKKK